MKNKKNLIKIIILTLIFLHFVIAFFKGIISKEPYKKATVLQEGWTVEFDNQIIENVDIRKFRYLALERGKDLKYSIPLDSLYYYEPVIELYSTFSMVHVYLDDELIYSYGEEKYREGTIVGSGYNIIPLPEDYKGKILTINLTPSIANERIWIRPILINESMEEASDFFRSKFPYLSFSVTLIVFGSILILSGGTMAFFQNIFLQWLYGGFFMVFVGTWLLNYTGSIFLFNSDLNIKLNLEYFSLYSLPLISVCFLFVLYRKLKMSRFDMLNLALIIFDAIALGVVLILHLGDVYYMPKFLIFFHSLYFIHIIFYFILGIYYLINTNDKEYRILIYGMFALVVTSLIGLSFFYVYRIIGLKADVLPVFIATGTVIFILSLVVTILQNVIRELSKESKENIRKKYHKLEPQTGLDNRLALVEDLRNIKRQDDPFTLINYDFEDFDQFNKDFGFESGDIVINEMANCLINADEEAKIYRTGGDSFAVILKTFNRILVKDYMNKVLNKFNSFINEEYFVELNINSGVVYGDEGEITTPEKLATIAEIRTMRKAEV